MPLSIAKREIDIDQAGRGKASWKYRFFHERNFQAGTGDLERSRHTGDPGPGHHNIILPLKNSGGHFAGFQVRPRWRMMSAT